MKLFWILAVFLAADSAGATNSSSTAFKTLAEDVQTKASEITSINELTSQTYHQGSPNIKPHITPQIENIIKNHSNGFCILILMRGIPGSGKSTLARRIIDETIGAGDINYKTHIASTDDYWMDNGTYKFNLSRIAEAREWNQRRAYIMMKRGISPVIIDNPNINTMAMEPYCRSGVEEGYFIEPVQTNTPWAQNVTKSAEKGIHKVPIEKLNLFLKNFEYNYITGYELLRILGLSYAPDKMPPVIRNIPPFIINSAL